MIGETPGNRPPEFASKVPDKLTDSGRPVLGRLEKVDLRAIWTNEARDFTPWLATEENLKLLSEAIGVTLLFDTMEKEVGPYRCDILCKIEGSESFVIIENQIEKTDHWHLGQLLTYAAGINASVIVWVASRFTEQHQAALQWLNEYTTEAISFFGLEVELWRIGDSPAAPKFNVVARPNSFVKRTMAERSQVAGGNALYFDYWTAFKEFLDTRETRFKFNKPGGDSWRVYSIGNSGYVLVPAISAQKKSIRVEFVMQNDFDKVRFRALEKARGQIDSLLPGLDWKEKPHAAESSVGFLLQGADVANKEDWPRQHEWLLEKLEALHRVLVPWVPELETARLTSVQSEVE